MNYGTYTYTRYNTISEKYINGEMGYEELKTALNKLDLSADEYLELLADICNRLKES